MLKKANERRQCTITVLGVVSTPAADSAVVHASPTRVTSPSPAPDLVVVVVLVAAAAVVEVATHSPPRPAAPASEYAAAAWPADD